MSETPLTERQESLLSHLESAYLLAQSISPDAETATHLVESAYTQAFVTLPLSNTAHDEKRWLFRLLLQIRMEEAEIERLQREKEADAEPLPGVLSDLRRRLAGQIADRTLPTVLATLAEDQRLVLLLCDAEGLSCEDAGYVLDLDTEHVCLQLNQARTTINESLRAGVSEQERHLIDQNLPDDWLRPTLRRTVEAAFDLPPSTLRHAILASTANAELEPTLSVEPPAASKTPSSAETPDDRRGPDARPRQARGGRLRRLVVVVFLVAAVASIGYLASQSLNREPETNLIALSVKQADAVRPSLTTENPEEAEAYVWDQAQWRLTLPSIDEATLSGVGFREVAPSITVPVFLYQDTATEDVRRIALYVFNYALLDRHGDRIQLEPEILRQIQNDQRFDLHDLGERNVLVWRNRDDIYVAVTPGDPNALRQRIVIPS